MAAFGAERKLLFEVNCFRFCPEAVILACDRFG